MLDIETDDPVAYSLPLNLHRRHLTVSQAAMCADRALKIYETEAKDRQKRSKGRGKKDPVNCTDLNGGDARDKAGKDFGVSGASVTRAGQVRKQGIPELGKQVDAGALSVNRASVIASHPQALQKTCWRRTWPRRRNHLPLRRSPGAVIVGVVALHRGRPPINGNCFC